MGLQRDLPALLAVQLDPGRVGEGEAVARHHEAPGVGQRIGGLALDPLETRGERRPVTGLRQLRPHDRERGGDVAVGAALVGLGLARARRREAECGGEEEGPSGGAGPS